MKIEKTFEEAFAEVEKITDRLGEPVDDKIKNLVAALLMFGIRTTMSCEGHRDRAAYPWVDVDPADAIRLNRMVAIQNRPTLDDGGENSNLWVVLPAGEYLWLVPWNVDRPLEELQRGAEAFAERLRQFAD
ncbi:MAG: hypothetical protein ACREGH_01580 [Minisyncoccia bacterium]